MGDPKEQNGSFNIAMNQAKEDLLSYKEEKCMEGTLLPTDLMPLVAMCLPYTSLLYMTEDKCMEGTLLPTDLMPLINKAWSKSFARVNQNRKGFQPRSAIAFLFCSCQPK